MKRAYLILWCAAVAILAYLILDYWNARNATPLVKFERQWAEDVAQLEASKKLPKPWFDVREVELFGGTPESRGWLKEMKIPVAQKNPDGQHKLEVLIVPWEEDGKTGVMIQYNLTELKSKNMIYELGRTLILSDAKAKDPIKAFLDEMKL